MNASMNGSRFRGSRRVVVVWGALASVLLASACASTAFDRALRARQWSDASVAFTADTALLHNEGALFRAAMLYSVPGRETYDPERARELFRQFLRRYPQSRNAQAAADQLALLYELQRVQTEGEVQVRDLRLEMERLAADTLRLHARLDSLAVRLQAEQEQSALLRKIATRLENDLQDRENRLRELNAELAKLKEIDLKSTRRTRAGDTTNRVRTVPVR